MLFKNLFPILKCKEDQVNPLILKGEEARTWTAKSGSATLQQYSEVLQIAVVCPICKNGFGHLIPGITNLRGVIDTWNRNQG
jgi:phage FluMu protein Com